MAVDKTTLKVMNKLFEKGYTTEKAVAAFNIEDICVVECYTPSEVARLVALRDAAKTNKVISLLSGEQDVGKQEDSQE